MSDNKNAQKEFLINGKSVRYKVEDGKEWFSITDLARHFGKGKPGATVRNWLRNRDTLNYLEEYEKIMNEDFNVTQMEHVKSKFGKNENKPSVSEYIEKTNAKFLITKTGRYGGTWACFNIAIQFCMWISSRFQIWFIRDYQRMKEDEIQGQLSYEKWKTQKNIDAAQQIIRFEEERLESLKQIKEK